MSRRYPRGGDSTDLTGEKIGEHMDFNTLFPNGFDATKYRSQPVSNNPPSVEAWQFLTGLGYKPPFMQQGKLMRFPDSHDLAKNDAKGTGGWCIYNEFSNGDSIVGFLSYGSWHEGTKESWSSISQDYMTPEQRAAFHDAVESARRLRDEQDRKEKEIARAKFAELWDRLNEADPQHEYLKRKGIKPHGVKQDGQAIIVPMYDLEQLVGLQEIYPNGDKKFKRHSTKGFFVIGDLDEGMAFICEGYSTGASIHEATCKPVVVAFDAGNLINVCSLLKDKVTLVICADDDKHGDINTGMVKAKQCADMFNLRILTPRTSGTDFNDMAQEHGILATAEYIEECMEVKQVKKRKSKYEIENPHGAIGLIADYYNATSGNEQRGFAIQTALAIGSLVCSRNFRTDEDNFSSIYLLNVGKTATGKEHAKTIIERVLDAGGLQNKVIGDGFTSAGGVMTELLRKPRSISIIDEFGMYLEAANNKGSSHQKEANSYLMQSITRPQGIMRAKNYSGMANKGKEEINDRYVCNPALTLLGITTPSTFFDNINDKDIHSGFLNRFIISISNARPAVRKRVEQIPVPDPIVSWIRAINKRAEKAGAIEVPVESPSFITIKISDPAHKIQRAFEQEMVNEMEALSDRGLEGLAGRTNEMAMRLSLIIALGRDPNTEIIGDIDMLWATNYMRNAYKQMYDSVVGNIVANQFEADKNKILQFIGNDSKTRTDIAKSFRGHSTKYIDDLIKSLLEANEIQRKTQTGVGRPSEKFVKTEID